MTALVYVHPYKGCTYRVPGFVVGNFGPDAKLVKFRVSREWKFRAFKNENIYLKPKAEKDD